MKETLQKGKTEWMRSVQEMISLFFIFLGFCICLGDSLNLSIPGNILVLAGLTAAAGAKLLGWNWKWMTAGLTVCLGLSLWIWQSYQRILISGMKELANRVLELVNAYHRTDYLYWYLEASESYGWRILLLLCILLGVVEGILLQKTRNRAYHIWAASLLPILVVAAGLTVGKSPSLLGSLFLLTGIAANILDIRQKGVAFLLGCMGLCMSVSALAAQNSFLWNQVEILHEDWLKRQLEFENRLLAVLSEIRNVSIFAEKEQMELTLNNDPPEQAGSKVFEITVNEPVHEKLYIRGFVGGDYQEGTWNRVSRQEFSDWAQSQGGSEQEYARIVQSFPYRFLEAGRGMYVPFLGERRNVSMQMEKRPGGYTLTPYFTSIPEEQPLKSDGSIPPVKDSQFQWDTYLKLTDLEENIAVTLQDDILFSDFLEDYQVWKSYETYVRQTYTRLPETGLSRLWAYQEEQKQQNQGQQRRLTEQEQQFLWGGYGKEQWELRMVQQTIQQMLWENNVYSFDLETVPEGWDVTEYFLLKQHKGYCTHFAAAATLLFRMNEIPARYVSGYLVLPSDFKENQDGTWTAVVTDLRAHAWTEVFGRNIGFYPVEMTPSSYIEMLEQMGEEETLAQAVAREERKNLAESPQMEQEQKMEEEQQQEQKAQSSNEKDAKQEEAKGSKKSGQSIPRRLAVGCAVFLAGISALCLMVIVRRKWILNKREQRLFQKDRTQAALQVGREINGILNSRGFGQKQETSDREYWQLLAQNPELAQMDWEQIFYLLQKAAFSRNGVTEEEYQEVLNHYQGLKQRLVPKDGVRGLYYKYIKIYS